MSTDYLDLEAVIRSIRFALEHQTDFIGSIRRVRGMITNLPSTSIQIKHDRNVINFYEKRQSCRSYLRKGSDRLYLLARKRYLMELLKSIEMMQSSQNSPAKWEKQFGRLEQLICDYAEGNLDVARIVLTQKQYAWFTTSYKQKPFVPEPGIEPLITDQGDRVRSKSEQNIGNSLWHFAVPSHYEEALLINVQEIVRRLGADLREANQLKRDLFYYRGNVCYWNVPETLQFMNAKGSIWHTYSYRTGCILIYPDYKIMLANGDVIYWEHEGLLLQFRYRVNASERVAIMRLCGGIDRNNMIETTEAESNDRLAREKIVKTQILPRLWF